jgi:predicted RNA-binding Zn ribbon-like protein
MALLWIDFVNSLAHDALGRGPDADRLDRPGWLEGFLKKWSLPAGAAGPAGVEAMKVLRDLLRACTERVAAGKPLRPADVAALNRALRARPVVARLEKEGESWRVAMEPVAAGLESALGAIARSFADFVCTEDPARLKLCGNPDCRWVFYDATRSRTRRWCADSCGNLMKVRRFRARGKDSPPRGASGS